MRKIASDKKAEERFFERGARRNSVNGDGNATIYKERTMHFKRLNRRPMTKTEAIAACDAPLGRKENFSWRAEIQFPQVCGRRAIINRR